MPPTSPALPKLQRTNELGDSFASLLAYAPPRWGKTMLTRTAEDPIVMACEMGKKRGLGTLQDLNIPFIPIDEFSVALAVARELARNREVATFEGIEAKTIIVDSGSVLGELGLDGAKATFGFGDSLWDATPGSGKDPRRAYPYMNEKMRQFMKIIMSCSAHVLVIARESLFEEDAGDGKKIQYRVPEFPGTKLPLELPGWPDGVVRGDIINGVRLLRTKTHARAVAGIRIPGVDMPEFIIPNTKLLCDYMRTLDPNTLAKLKYTPPQRNQPAAPAPAKAPNAPAASR